LIIDNILDLLPVIIGLIAGILSGLLGIGGGIIFVPFLLFYLPIELGTRELLVKHSVATSLFAGAFSTTSSAVNHYLRKNVIKKEAILLGIGSVAATILFHYFVVKVDAVIISYVIIFLLLFILSENLFFNGRFEITAEIPKYYLLLFGLAMGFISILTGLGGGVLAVPVFTYFYRIDIKKAVGTSSVVVACTMMSAAFMHLGISDSSLVVVSTGLLMGISAVVGAFIGVGMTARVSDTTIRIIFSIFLIITIIKLSFDVWFS